jgi:DNA recombination protein RmuC
MSVPELLGDEAGLGDVGRAARDEVHLARERVGDPVHGERRIGEREESA